jgi:hypothetical protein
LSSTGKIRVAVQFVGAGRVAEREVCRCEL